MESMGIDKSIELKDLFLILKRRIWTIIIITLVFGLLSAVLNFFIIKPVYESKSSILIEKAEDNQAIKDHFDYEDLMTYRNPIATCVEIAQSRELAQKVLKTLDLQNKLTIEKFQKNLIISGVPSTQIMKVAVQNNDPRVAMELNSEIIKVFESESKAIFPKESITVIDEPVIPTLPIKPHKVNNIGVSVILGFVLSITYVFMREYLKS